MAWREQLQIGELTVEKPLRFQSYILADLPDPALWLGATVYVSDATPPNLATSDGTIWAAADDGLVSA
jgi:hypothetical protein